MVKVFPNSSFSIFKGQKFVRTASEPVAVDCSCSHVFLATKSCTIEAYSCTEAEPTIVGEFATIHPVKKLVYTVKGDCLLTSEAKDSRSPSQARVYFNWLGATKNAGVRPRPAHAASTQSYVTPRIHQKQPSVEVVDLGIQSGSPGRGRGLCIGSCSASGIIGVASGYDIRLYMLQQITPSTSDGAANSIPGNACYDVTVFADISLGFEIRSLSLSHNYLAAMSSQEVHVLKWQVSGAAHLAFHSPFLYEDDTVDGGVMNDAETTESTFVKDPHCIVWAAQTTGDISATTSSRPGSRAGSRAPSPVLGASTLDVHSSTSSSIPIPSCVPSPSGMGVISLKKVAKAAKHRPEGHAKQPREVLGPMDYIRGVPASFVYRSQARGRVEASLFTLLYKCDPAEGGRGDAARMNFRSTHLMPVTVNAEDGSSHLTGMGCLVVTESQAFFYNILSRVVQVHNFSFIHPGQMFCYDGDFLHILNEGGLETYTTRLLPSCLQVLHRDIKFDGSFAGSSTEGPRLSTRQLLTKVCPPTSIQVTNVSRKNLIGACIVAASHSQVVVITKALKEVPAPSKGRKDSMSNVEWNIYILEKHAILDIALEFMSTAEQFRTCSPPTTRDLVSEAHLLVRLQLLSSAQDGDLQKMLRDTCLQLSKYFGDRGRDTDVVLASSYLQLALVEPGEAIALLRHLNVKALLLYLDAVLFAPSWPHKELPQSTVDTIWGLYAEHRPGSLPNVFMNSWIKDYDPERALTLLRSSSSVLTSQRLVSPAPGYWKFVCQFTHSETLKAICQLPQVNTDRGRGRAWLMLALNEQSLESYIRNFQHNKDITAQFYESAAVMRSKDQLVLLQTLLAGLDFIVFNLSLDSPYLDIAICDPSVSTKIKKNFAKAQQPQEPGSSPIPISNSVQNNGIQDDTRKLSVDRSPPESPVGETKADTDTDPQPQSISSEGSLPKACSLEQSDKVDDVIPMESSLESLRLAQHRLNAVFTDSGYFSVDNPSPQPHVHDLDSFNVVSLRGGRPRGKDGKKSSSKKGGAKSKRPASIPAIPVARQSVPEEVTEHNRELPESKQEVATLEGSGVIGKSDMTQVFKCEEVDVERVGGNEKEGLEATDAGPAEEASPTAKVVQPLQPEHDPQQQSEQLSLDPEPVDKVEAAKMILNTDCVTAPVAGVECTTTEEECPVESTDGGEGEVADVIEEKLVSMEGSEGGHRSPVDEEGGDRSGEDVSDAGREKGGRSGSEGDDVVQTSKRSSLDVLSFGVPERPMKITKQDKFATEVLISQNNKLLLSLNVCFDSSEELHKLLQIYRFAGRAVLQVCYVLITDEAVYILEDSESEAGYSRLTGARFKDLEDIQVGLNWQSLTLVYGSPPEYHMMVTCNEPVTRGVIECITDMSSKQRPRWGRISMSKGDKTRWKALEQILPLETESDVQLYSIAYWEQMDGNMPPPCLFPTSASLSTAPVMQGPLLLKSNKFGVPYWKPSFFALSEDALLQYNSEVDSTIRAKYPVQQSTFGGCRRLPKEGRANAFMVTLAGTEFIFATKTETEMIKWMQAICEAATVQVAGGVTLGGRYGILLTEDMIHVLQEDWQAQKIEQLTCCKLEDVEHIGWDPDLPLYCVLSYDNTESPSGVSGSWLFCFSSSFELGKFETTVAQLWQEKMQIELEFNVITSEIVKKRARDAIELLHASKNRSDSVTKGREFIKPQL